MNQNDIQMKDQTLPLTPQEIPKIRVIVRKRPLNKKEQAKSEMDCIEIKSKSVIVKELKNKVDLTKFVEEHQFQFDLAYSELSSNEEIYLEAVRPMIEAAFVNKAKVTCFAYGQTGSGKTFTMMGPNQLALEMGIPGLYLLSAYDIFSFLEDERFSHLEIYSSFYEIYCGKLFDLLNERALLTAREDGKGNICIVGLTEKPVMNLQNMMNLIEFGLRARTVGVTGANSDSSRSHAIIQISIKNQQNLQHGKISFIDLAGSERAADTIDTNKQTRIEGAEINQSLLQLKECIRALDQEKKHTPFRGSKLTMVLRDSFMGNCKTLMIANISPCLSCVEHTLNTLRYADRVKELRRDKEERVRENVQDPNEMLANILMMPRLHSKTVKYNVNVDKNNQVHRNSISSSNNLLNNGNNTGNKKSLPQYSSNPSQPANVASLTKSINSVQSNHSINSNKENNTNAVYQSVESQLHNLLNRKKPSDQQLQSLMNQNNLNNQNNNTGKSSVRYINNYNSYSYNNNPNPNNINNINSINSLNNVSNTNNNLSTARQSMYSNQSNTSRSPMVEVEDDLTKLAEKHEKLINMILSEEEFYIENHKKHIEDMKELQNKVNMK
jgi:kinesin family protein 2/24